MTESSSSKTSQWHADSTEQVLSRLDADTSGLGCDEAQARLSSYGPNRLPEGVQQSRLKRFLLQFHNTLIYVLLGTALITALLTHYVDTGLILAVIVVNAVIGYVQEGKAEKALSAIRQMLAPRASVIRDDTRQAIMAENLVPGDIVLLEAGDRVPADLRLLQAYGLQIQEAILTGESMASDKGSDAVDGAAALGERSSMAFSGTMVVNGQGRGVVVRTGESTEIGRITSLLSGVETLTTPLVEQMDVFGRWLTGFILLVAAAIFVTGLFVGDLTVTGLFIAVVGLTVAAIPEGLPAVLTITLAVGVQAMAHRNAIIRRLPAIETLGAVSVIGTDKTGTLTRNEMNAVTLEDAVTRLAISGEGYNPDGSVHEDGQPLDEHALQRWARVAQVAILCNDAELREKEDEWLVEGDPMEGALAVMGARLGLAPRELRQAMPRIDAIPFDAGHRYMATLNEEEEGGGRGIYLKGAPEAVLSLCSHQYGSDGDQVPLEADQWRERVEEIAAEGQRVLALAWRRVSSSVDRLTHEEMEEPLILLALVGLIDPPREESIAAIRDCRAAGIRVIMITGDHASTAMAIGRNIGLERTETVMTGADLDALDDDSLPDAIGDSDVFARTSPEHKLRLVSALQSRDLTVAMTGDGVNDAPALKRADVGIAMGRKGSEAAREASDLVLADDDFASIASAVREGRTVYDNITKVISWTLPTNAGEAGPILLALLLGVALPITAVQILWVNMITAVTLGIALAFEPTGERIMRRPPRPRNQPLLSGTLIWYVTLVSALIIAAVFGMYQYSLAQGYSLEVSRTVAMDTLVVMEIFQLFFIRNLDTVSLTWQKVRGTRAVWIAVTIVVVAQMAMTWSPWMQALFQTDGLNVRQSLEVLSCGVALFVILELEKQLRLRWPGWRHAKP